MKYSVTRRRKQTAGITIILSNLTLKEARILRQGLSTVFRRVKFKAIFDIQPA